MPRFFPATALLVSALPLLLTSCRKPEIRVYLAPKDSPPAATKDTAEDAHEQTPRAERPRPKVTWTLPAGWQESAPNEVSVAAFSVKTSAGGSDAFKRPTRPRLSSVRDTGSREQADDHRE